MVNARSMSAAPRLPIDPNLLRMQSAARVQGPAWKEVLETGDVAAAVRQHGIDRPELIERLQEAAVESRPVMQAIQHKKNYFEITRQFELTLPAALGKLQFRMLRPEGLAHALFLEGQRAVDVAPFLGVPSPSETWGKPLPIWNALVRVENREGFKDIRNSRPVAYFSRTVGAHAKQSHFFQDALQRKTDEIKLRSDELCDAIHDLKTVGELASEFNFSGPQAVLELQKTMIDEGTPAWVFRFLGFSTDQVGKVIGIPERQLFGGESDEIRTLIEESPTVEKLCNGATPRELIAAYREAIDEFQKEGPELIELYFEKAASFEAGPVLDLIDEGCDVDEVIKTFRLTDPKVCKSLHDWADQLSGTSSDEEEDAAEAAEAAEAAPDRGQWPLTLPPPV